LLKIGQKHQTLHEDLSEGKGKGHPGTGREGPKGEWVYGSTLSLTTTPVVGGWSAPRPGRFIPGPLETGVENLAPHRDSIPGPSSP